MVTVLTPALPDNSALHPYFQTGDFMDCFATPSDLNVRHAAEIVTSFPSWAQALIKVREIFTRLFGLKQSGPDTCNNTGDHVGIFPITYETDTELLAGFNDKHLDFRVSVLSHSGLIHVSTWVHSHNIGGRSYLALIMPFHTLIARDAVKQVGRAG